MITVNSISFSNLLRPSQPNTLNLVGNSGDTITATINITATQAVNDFLFSTNCVPNSQTIYSQPSDTDIFDSAFNSLTNNTPQVFARNNGIINSIIPKDFDNSISVTITNTGGFDYNIEHIFKLTPILRENELTTKNEFKNASYYSKTGLKYVFKIESINNGVLIESTDGANLEASNIIRNGAVSGWGSSLGTGAINYQLIVAPSILDKNSDLQTTYTAQIKKNSGAWVLTDLISYRLQKISEISDFEFNESLLTNTKFDDVTHTIESASENGLNNFILDCSCAIDATDNTLLNITFSVIKNYAERFSVFFAVSKDVVDLEHQNTLATFGTESLQPISSQVEFVNYAGANQNFDILFINWYNQTFPSEGFNHLRAYRKDDNEVLFGVRIINAAISRGVSFVSLNCGFKDLNTGLFLTGEFFDFDFSTPVPFSLDRGYIRKSDNPKKYIQVNFVGDRYEFRYGFNVDKNFLQSDNIVFEANINFKDSGGFIITNTIRSPQIEIGQYDVTQNTIAEPQVLAVIPQQTKFYTVDGANTPDFAAEFDGIVAGQNMLVETTFEDNNLNDLQTSQDDLAGYLGLTTSNELKETERYFFSTYLSETNSPFEAINGHTAGLVKVTKIDIKTVKLSAIINYERLKIAFPSQNDICVISRIDRPQPPKFSFFKDISLHFTSSPSGSVLITNPVSANWINQKFFFDGNRTNADFNFKISPTGAIAKDDAAWSLVPPLSVAQFEGSAILTGYTVRIECNVGTNTDSVARIQFVSLLPTAVPFSGVHNRSARTALNDFLAFYESDLSIVSVTAANTNRFHSVRDDAILAASSDLTNFTAFNLATLNAQLVASPQKYGHFFQQPTTSNPTTTTITGNFGAANREVVEYISPSKYEFAPFLSNPLSWQNDRINDRLIATDLAVASSLDYSQVANGDYMIVQVTFRHQTPLGNFNTICGVGNNSAGTILYTFGNNLRFGIILTGDLGSVLIAPISLISGQVYTVTVCARKGSNTVGGASVKFNVPDSFIIINGRRLSLSSAQAFTNPYNPSGIDKMYFNTRLNASFIEGGSIYHTAFRVSNTPISFEDCRRYALGNIIPMPYSYKFDNYSNPNTFNNIGTLPANPAIATNHVGTLTNLYL